MNTRPDDFAETFGPPIYTYTRARAVADGFQVEVTKTAAEAGIKFPVFLTRTVYDSFVTVPSSVIGQDEAGRLWDIVWMLRFAICKAQTGQVRLSFALYVRNDNHRPRLIKLIAICGPVDIDDPAPAITVMLPDERLGTATTHFAYGVVAPDCKPERPPGVASSSEIAHNPLKRRTLTMKKA